MKSKQLFGKSKWLALSLFGMMLCPLPVSAETSSDVLKAADAQSVTPQQSAKVSGTVVDNNGEPIIGATVQEKGTKNAAITDLDGNFSLDVSKSGTTIVVSYVGYKAQEVRTGSGPVKIVLAEDAAQLEGVVVIGYGSVKKKDLTGSVVQIRPDRLAAENPQTVQDVLRGTAGLNVGYSNDAKGGGSLNIRGQRSVYTDGGHNDPLIILDGMQFYGELSEINPDDIEQIDVLKDASSAAIYGAKAANGVIIITTKKGKNGKPVVNFTANVGAVTRAGYQRVFTPEEYLQHKVDYFEMQTYGMDANGRLATYQTENMKDKVGYYRNPNDLPSGVSLDQWRGYDTGTEGMNDLEIWAHRINMFGNLADNLVAGNTTDWKDYVYRTGFQQDYNASLSGASDRMNYYLSAGYLNNQGTRYHNSYESYRANMKISGDVNKWFSLGANVNFQERTDGTLNDPSGLMDISPYADRYDADGNLLQYMLTDVRYTMYKTQADWEAQYRDRERGYTVLNTIINATVKLPYNITYAFNISPRYQWYYNRYFTSQAQPDSNPTSRGVDRNSSKRFDYSLNNTLTWDQTFFDKHHVVVTLVQEYEDRKYWSDNLQTRNITPSDALGFHYTTTGDKDNTTWSTDDTHETADALLARLQYTYDDRYMLTASVRRDGYSAFGQNNPHATFPSVAAAWTFTNEKFWKWDDILDYGKLRVSFGKNGNRSLSNPYVALSNLTTGTWANYIINGAVVDRSYLRVDRLANPNLEWEKSQAWNVGLDFSFLRGRITGAIEYYQMQTKDMIMNQRLPKFTGFDNITTNLGRVDNSGFEFTLNTVNIKNPTIEWRTQFTLSYNNNKIKHLYGNYDENGVEQDDLSNQWFIGHAIDEIWDYKILGVWQQDQAEEAAKYGQVPGDPIVWNNPDNDVDGKPYYDDDDKVFLGKRTAPTRLSMRNDFTILKNLSVGFSLYGYFGWKSNASDLWGGSEGDAFLNNENGGGFLDFGMRNQPWKKYWTPDHPQTEYARLNAQGPNGIKPHYYINRSFVRFDNLSVAYTLPKAWIEALQLSNVKVYANVKNLGTIHSDRWIYGDPENQSFSTRTYSFGLNVTF